MGWWQWWLPRNTAEEMGCVRRNKVAWGKTRSMVVTSARKFCFQLRSHAASHQGTVIRFQAWMMRSVLSSFNNVSPEATFFKLGARGPVMWLQNDSYNNFNNVSPEATFSRDLSS